MPGWLSLIPAFLWQVLQEHEPLLGYDLYGEFLVAGAGRVDEEGEELPGHGKEGRYQQLLHRLPPTTRDLLAHLLRHLRLVAAHSEDNRMTAENLAATIGVNLLRRSESVAGTVSCVCPFRIYLERPLSHSLCHTHECGRCHYTAAGERATDRHGPDCALPPPLPPAHRGRGTTAASKTRPRAASPIGAERGADDSHHPLPLLLLDGRDWPAGRGVGPRGGRRRGRGTGRAWAAAITTIPKAPTSQAPRPTCRRHRRGDASVGPPKAASLAAADFLQRVGCVLHLFFLLICRCGRQATGQHRARQPGTRGRRRKCQQLSKMSVPWQQ